MSRDLYALKGKKAVRCENVKAWGQWVKVADRVVARTAGRGIDASTVFLALDHRHGKGKHLLFETMTFSTGGEEDCERCSTWDEAETQHRQMCEKHFDISGVLIIWNEERV